MDTPYAYWVWLEQEDGTYTRGIPSKVPYMVTRNPYKVTVAGYMAFGFHLTQDNTGSVSHGFYITQD